MAYLGGKSTVHNHITNVLNHKKYDGYHYIEPFCGYCHILRRVQNKRTYNASDSNSILVALLKRIQTKNLRFPRITRIKYETLKKKTTSGTLHPNETWLAGLAAFCYSFNGKEFGGYAPTSADRDYVKERTNYYKLLSENQVFSKTTLRQKPFAKVLPSKKSLIYCDPPYAHTTKYGKNGFDSESFWEHCRKLVKLGHVVYVSEYTAPRDFYMVSKAQKYSTVGGTGCTGTPRTEKLFKHISQKLA